MIGGTPDPSAPIFGVDVSKFNPLSDVPAEASFVIVRMSYHCTPDPLAAEHVRQARTRGQLVGPYGFPILTNPIQPQLEQFLQQCRLCGIGAGDIVPHGDIEAYPVSSARDASQQPLDVDPRELRAASAEPLCPGTPLERSARYTLEQPSPAWVEGLEEWCSGLVRAFGACGIYWTQTTWSQMGKPPEFSLHRQWVAHWRTQPGAPASPYGYYDIWQHRVGPPQLGGLHVIGQHDDQHAIDHDRCDSVLPLIGTAAQPPAEQPTNAEILSAVQENRQLIDALHARLDGLWRRT